MVLKFRAYAVHAFTAIGAVLGVWAFVLILNEHYQATLWVLLAAGLIDTADGALARAADVQKNAPMINGALMDNIIDFLIWTAAPLLWAYAVVQVPVWVILICTFASIFGFTNKEAKTEDNYFTGFPSYWNLVIFYLFLLHFSVVVSSAILLFCAVATFLPVKFIYPSKMKTYQMTTIVLGVIFALELVALVFLFDQSPRWLVYISLIFPAYYLGLSFIFN